MSRYVDLTGQRFGRLLVTERTEKQGNHYLWKCLCDCGEAKIVRSDPLISGTTKSCGCLRRERLTTHGLRYSRMYAIWRNIMARCYNESYIQYADYGGRGIKVDPRWHKFENFYEDVGEIPKGLVIDRVDNDGDYSPSNFRHANYFVSNGNRRDNVWLEHNGKNQIIADWARELGLSHQTITKRLKRGWSVSDALTT